MDQHDVLQRIPLFEYEGNDYLETKKYNFHFFNEYLQAGCTVCQSVNGTFYYAMEEDMDENGMEKFVAMICGMLFQIEHNDVEPDLAYGTNWDIDDFETGNYDDLFSETDLKLLKADIKFIKDYFKTHGVLDQFKEEYEEARAKIISEKRDRDANSICTKVWKHRE